LLKRVPVELQSAVDVPRMGHRLPGSAYPWCHRAGVDANDCPAENRVATPAQTSVPPGRAMESLIVGTMDRNTEPARLESANDEIPKGPQ